MQKSLLPRRDCTTCLTRTPAAVCVFMCKSAKSSEGDVSETDPSRLRGGFWEKRGVWGGGRSADDNPGIVGYYFGSLAQTESSCCPAVEPKQPVHLPREAETNRVCTSVSERPPTPTLVRPAFGSQAAREGRVQAQTIQSLPSLARFLFSSQTFCPESPQAASSIFPIISYL